MVGDVVNVVTIRTLQLTVRTLQLTVRTFIADGQNLTVDGDEDLWREVYGA